MKKVLIVDPYLDVFGGGEKHILSIGKVFEEHGYAVSLFWKDARILRLLGDRLNINVSSFTIEQVERKGAGYDVLLYVTDGSYFFGAAKKNYVFCMYPQKNLYTRSLITIAKWRGWSFFANSHYTATFISDWVGKKVGVVYPHIDESIFQSYSPIGQKKKMILSVGRFFRHLHAKNQHVLIEAFNQLQERHEEFTDFPLVLIGSVKNEDEDYFDEIQKLAKGNKSIHIIKSAPYSEILEYFKTSLFYWHAAGLNADLESHPEAAEHLGMSVIEAMVAGCVTFAHNSGGPKETIENEKNGFLYETIDELIIETADVYKSNNRLPRISGAAKKYCEERFSKEVFEEKVREYFKL